MKQLSPEFREVSISIFIVFWLIIAAFPFIWTLWGSFKIEADFFSKADWMNALFAPRTIARKVGPLREMVIMELGCKRTFGKRS